MPFDPSKPANNSPISSAELREQLQSLKALIDAQAAQIAALQAELNNRVTTEDFEDAINGTAQNPSGISPLSIGWDNPISQDNTQAIVNRLNELISALGR